jgi:hypothetical protein
MIRSTLKQIPSPISENQIGEEMKIQSMETNKIRWAD